MCVDKELSILGENIKLVSVEGYLAWSGKIRKGQRRRLVKENQKTEIGLLRVLCTMVRSLNFILKAINSLQRISCRERSHLSLKDQSVGSVENGWVLNICWVNEWFLNSTLDLTIWWFFKLHYKYWQIAEINISEWWSSSMGEDKIVPNFSEHKKMGNFP